MIKLFNGINEVAMQRLTFGPNTYGDEENMDKYLMFLDMYTEAGGSSVDTARVYSGGQTEEAIGRWFKTRKNRDKIVLTTKGGHPPAGDMHKPRLDRENIFSDIKASLAALSTDYTDVYLLHRDCREMPVGEIVDTLDELVKTGLAKVCGVSNWRTDRIKEANEYAKQHSKARICVSQINYSLAETTPERLGDDTLVCMTDAEFNTYMEMKLPVMAFSSQAKGFFAKLAAGEDLKSKATDRFLTEENLKRFERVKEVAAQTGLSPSAVALSFLTCNPLPVSAVFSCRTQEQMKDTLTAMNAKLDEKTVAYLEKG